MLEQVPQTGWASTKPGRTRFHFYDAAGKSLCSYQRQPGLLHAWTGTRKIPEDACSSCELHFKRQKADTSNARPLPSLPNQSC